MSAVTPDPAHALTPSGNLRRRMAVSRALVWATIVAAALAVAVLFILVYYVAKQGAGHLSWSFLTAQLPLLGFSTGAPTGIGPAIVGSAEIVAIATVLAVPVGVLTAVYLCEFANPRIAAPVQTVLELMAGLPTIVAGIFVSGLLVTQSAYAAGVALSIVQVPLIARASMESIRRVPGALREAADALGVARWRTIVGVILPTAAGGIVTATVLAVARASGETAPVLFTSSAFGTHYQLNPAQQVPNLPVEIYNLVNSGNPAEMTVAWGAAFLLIMLILVTNIAARVWLRHSERKRGL